MDRKDAIKILGLAGASPFLFLQACKKEGKKTLTFDKFNLEELSIKQSYAAGRQTWELERLEKIMNQPDFFTDHEMRTITVLGDIIIPKDEVSGSASDAKVPEFIAFIVKDIPSHQKPMRDGLKWLDKQCNKRYGNAFVDCSQKDQIAMVEAIAYPDIAPPEMQPGVEFFNKMRFLTASGFYTTQMGIEDIGYVGNQPNKWTGVPEDVLANYDVENFKED